METKLQLRKQGEQAPSGAKLQPRNRLQGVMAKMATELCAPLIRTIKIEKKGSTYHAPKSTCVRRIDSVLFMNDTGGDVTIQFAKKGIFGRPGLELKKGKKKHLDVDDNAPEGFHGYAVFCHGGRKFAKGGSMPIIIVDPKT